MKNCILCFIFFLISFLSYAQLITNKASLSKINQMLVLQKKLAAGRSEKLFKVLNTKITSDEKQALQFLFAFMPLSDLADYDGTFYLANARASLKARSEFSWCKNMPEDVFLHFVLPVRVNNENLDSFRIIMYDEIKARVQGKTMKEAALEINHWCHEKVTYRGTDERTSSPLATIKTSFGRCGEESTFTVAAMRTAGIPARQVYTPRWAHSDDNHAWVEVWIDGKWCFMGACEPEPELNMGWFAGPAARAMLVHTRAYGYYFGSESVIAKSDKYSELNLISNYAPVKSFVVKVTDSLGKPVENAKVEYQLYNYAEFFPIAKTITDKRGFTGITCGLGDLLIWANQGNLFAYSKISIAQIDTLKLILRNHYKYIANETFIFVPPVERMVKEVSESGRSENQNRLHLEDSIRTLYMKTFKDSVWANSFAEKNKLNADSVTDFILKSYGNWKEVCSFLENTTLINKKWALRLLSEITDKDLRDTKISVLNDHLNNSFLYASDIAVNDPELFSQYVLSGRISSEMMVSWRAYLQSMFNKIFARKAQQNIQEIIDWITKNISIDNISNVHSRAQLTPIGVYELRVSDARSRDVFFVALCRSLGIPSRLNAETMLPQYYFKKEWKAVEFTAGSDLTTSKGYIHFINSSKNIDPKYTVHFTIANFKEGVYRTLQYEENKLLSEFSEKLEVDAGNYLLVTGNRMTDGSVLCNTVYFVVEKEKTSDVNVLVREQKEKSAPWAKLDLNLFALEDSKSGTSKFLKELVNNNGALLVFLEPDKEPTKHVMDDLPAFKETFEKWNGGVVFIMNRNLVSKSFKSEDYKGLPAQSVFAWDLQNKLFSEISKLRKTDLKNAYPIIVIIHKDGNLTYYSEGYKIGIGVQIVKEIHNIIE